MRVLFIGNSHTYFNDMPYLFAQLAQSHGLQVETVMLTRGGESLAGHAESEQVRFNLLYGKYDLAILQEVESEFPGEQAYCQSVEKLLAFAKTAGTPAALYMNFAPEGQADRQRMLAAACQAAGRRFGLPVAQVGLAWAQALTRFPQIDLYAGDRRHASPAGSYLIALTLAWQLLGVPPQGRPFQISYQGQPLLRLPETDAQALQACAAALPGPASTQK